MSPVVPVGLAIFLLTLFLDLLEMSFGRILWFMRTLRFWLYFTLHFLISSLAAYLLHSKISDWYLLALVATLLGVAIVSNTNIKLAGFSLVPIADLFLSIKTKMIEQAGEDKALELRRAQLIQRLRKLDSKELEDACSSALLAANKTPEQIQAKIVRARTASKGNDDHFKNFLMGMLLRSNVAFVEGNIQAWCQSSEPPTATDQTSQRL
jgi:hypothetical protein